MGPKHMADNVIRQSLFPESEQIKEIPLSVLHPLPDYPYKVRDDEEMKEMIESIRDRGVLLPCIVRKREDVGNGMMIHCGNPCTYYDIAHGDLRSKIAGYGRLYEH